MSTEIDIIAMGLRAADRDLPESMMNPLDRVLHTADDRPNTATLPAMVDPAADHQLNSIDLRGDVEEKHRRIVRFLDEQGLDAVVLGRADSVSWFTGGGDLGRDLSSELASVLLYVNRQSRAVVCDNVQSARVFEEELAGLGFQLKERPWQDDPRRAVLEMGHNRKIASDIQLPPWPCERERLRALRLHLTARERQLIRVLGRTVTRSVEATGRNFMPGENEADVAGHLSHRLIRDGVVPVCLRVASEDRLERFRQPTYKAAPIHKRATISVVGRRHGLCVGVSRTVSFGAVEESFLKAHSLAAMVDATCLYFSRPGEKVAEVFRRARRIYEKFGQPDEWTLDYQGCLSGYSPCEYLFRPDSDLALGQNMVVRWTPSVRGARSEDTVVIDRRGYEVVTEAQDWPKVEVVVKGFSMLRPSILVRPVLG